MLIEKMKTAHRPPSQGMCQPAAPRPWLAALLWMAFLGPFFFLIYGTCNWITSLRYDVGTCFFEWERLIPFVPIFIIPYMSIDLFFAGSTFLCRDRAEMYTLVKRIVFAILFSAACFLLFPLRYGWKRPVVDGPLADVFALLTGLDQPHNLAPSLHISLRSIVWAVYGLHLAGWLRSAVKLWFVLIGASTLLVYQHHVIDVVTGDMVAIVCFYLFPGSATSDASHAGSMAGERGRKNWRVGGCYALLALILLTITWAGWPWSLVFAWPALSLTIVASGYFGFGTAVFRKSQGRLPWSARILLGPYLLGGYLSMLHYRRRGRLYDEVVPGIVIGCRLNRQEAEQAIRQGVQAVLDLTAEYPEVQPFLRLPYQNVQVLDLTTPTVGQLRQAVEFLQARVCKGKVYVHCALGRSRSVGVGAAYCLAAGWASTPEEAIALIRKARPQVVIKDDLLGILRTYHLTLKLKQE